MYNKVFRIISAIMKRLNQWKSSFAGVVSIVLLLLSVACSIVAFSPWGNFEPVVADKINNILLGLAATFLGSIVTVCFVQAILDKQNRKKEKLEERDKILRFDRVLSIILSRYKLYYNKVVTPLEGRNSVDAINLKTDFSFSDMRDLYKTTLLLKDKAYEPSIKLFYDTEKNLRKYMMQMLESIDFKYYNKMESVLIEFIEKSLTNDVSEAILGNYELDKNMIVEIENYIAEEEKYQWLERMRNGELESNIMIPYIQLYRTLKLEANILNEYSDCKFKVLRS